MDKGGQFEWDFPLGLSSRKTNKNLYFESLIGDFFTDTSRGEIYHLNNAPNSQFTKDYKGVIIPISDILDYTLSGYYLGTGKAVTLLDKDKKPLDTRNLNVAYGGTAITIDGAEWSEKADIHIKPLPNSVYLAYNVASSEQPEYWKTAKIQLEEGTASTPYVEGEGGLSGYINVREAKMFSKAENIGTLAPIINTPYRGRYSNKNLFSFSYIDDFFSDTTRGELYKLSAGTLGYKAVLIRITENTDYILSNYYLGAGKVVTLLDPFFRVKDTRNLKENYIGTAITIDAENWSDNADIHIKTFAECAYLVFNVATNAQPNYWLTAKIQLEIGTQKTNYVKGSGGIRGYLTLDDIELISSYIRKWFAQIMIWAGTSIPATGYDQIRHSDKAYPAIVGRKLGAIMYNEAESSSQARIAFNDGTEFDLDHQKLALAMTMAEKKQRGVDVKFSYEYKFFHEERSNAGLLVLDHGINDAHRDTIGFNLIPKKGADGKYNIEGLTDDYILREEGGVSELLPDWQNRKTFIGAMNFLIVEFLKHNPTGRIVIVTHHEDQKHRKVYNKTADGSTRVSEFDSIDVIKAQLVVAEYWSLPVIRLHEELGWSQRIVDGKTVYSYFANDELHPNQNVTGVSTNRIADVAIAKIEML